jgi:hypothetical protein
MKKNREPVEPAQPDAEEIKASRQQHFNEKKETQQRAHLRRERIRELREDKDW